VAAPVGLVTDPQLAARGFWEEVTHPVLGTFATTSMPFRFAGQPGPWIRTPAPLLGQHNDEVLGGLLGLTSDELAGLAGSGVVGTRPAGL
jgi:crotonobetainyl-CoA:carnitine CoA-transferase CaiB-like acyl-CoA transferase